MGELTRSVRRLGDLSVLKILARKGFDTLDKRLSKMAVCRVFMFVCVRAHVREVSLSAAWCASVCLYSSHDTSQNATRCFVTIRDQICT